MSLSIVMSPLKAWKCGRFLPLCSRCREFKCAQLNLCDTCVSWDGSCWQRVAAYEKKLKA